MIDTFILDELQYRIRGPSDSAGKYKSKIKRRLYLRIKTCERTRQHMKGNYYRYQVYFIESVKRI